MSDQIARNARQAELITDDRGAARLSRTEFQCAPVASYILELPIGWIPVTKIAQLVYRKAIPSNVARVRKRIPDLCRHFLPSGRLLICHRGERRRVEEIKIYDSTNPDDRGPAHDMIAYMLRRRQLTEEQLALAESILGQV